MAISAPRHPVVTPEVWSSAHEPLYPGVGKELYAAVRDDRLAQWVGAHPDYVTR